MSSIEGNRDVWQHGYDWPDGGEEWSAAWGGSDMQWHTTWMPRLHCFLPASTILEIASGFGRWTEFLQHHCDRLIAVDLVDRCVQECRRRFASNPRIECHLNDGKSLPMVEDGSIDLAVSFDSLVHVDFEVMDAYLGELSRVLTANGVAVLHHSNLGEFPGAGNPSDRDPEMTAARLAEAATQRDLRCVGQETFKWPGGPVLSDGISIVTKPGSTWDRQPRALANTRFTDEVEIASGLSDVYGWPSFTGARTGPPTNGEPGS
jgi:SAM-dependent methyltransferase